LIITSGRTEAPHDRASLRPCNLCGTRFPRAIFVKRGFTLVRCPSCGLVYVGDPPADSDLKELYSFAAGYHSGYGGDGNQQAASRLRAAEECYSLLARHKRAGRLLDVGCSAGFFLRVARDHGWEACGLEMSPDAASVARERYGLAVSTGSLEESTFPAKSFDAVTLWDVIEHLVDPVGTMSIVNRVLKDDGVVAFLTPNIDGLFPRIAYAAAKIIGYWPHPEPPHHLFQFSKTTARRLATRTGFTVRAVIDGRIPLTYSFGSLRGLLTSPAQLLYAACFAPIAAVGPAVGAGDQMIVIAGKGTVAASDEKRRTPLGDSESRAT
jgi:2-polyprenyl-3-methyl-5-hydroxy-6-metoxy-1,4-benzoquinol methylase